MSTSAATNCERVKAALAATGACVRNGEPNRWRVAWPELRASCLLQQADGWLLASSLSSVAADFARLPELLQLSARLPGHAKLALGRDNRLEARAELPWLPDEAQPFPALTPTGDGLRSALQLILEGRSATPSDTDTAGPAPRIESLKPALEESGWKFTARDGQFAVELEAPPSHYQATIESSGGSGVRAALVLAEFPATELDCARAVAWFLLSLAEQVRFVRAFLRAQESQLVAGMEVIFPHAPSAEELALAFGGLSVACARGGEEARILSQPALAQRALAVWGAETSTKNNHD